MVMKIKNEAVWRHLSARYLYCEHLKKEKFLDVDVYYCDENKKKWLATEKGKKYELFSFPDECLFIKHAKEGGKI